jgi:Kef-type K+ transport system membrane component KefB
MTTVEIFLIAMIAIFALPWLIWRLFHTDHYAPLVVVQILTGIMLGPGVLGQTAPDVYDFVFSPVVIQALNGIAWWAVSIFIMLAGVELNLQDTWAHRRESALTAGLALSVPLAFGTLAACLLVAFPGWIGDKATPWQFVVGIGMSCAVTALPILILILDKLAILRQPLGQRILRYASLDDIAIWGVLALILLDWVRLGRQVIFVGVFILVAYGYRKLMPRMLAADRWPMAMIWLGVCALGADWAGLHFMVGAFLAGAVMEAHWFDQAKLDALRDHVLMVMMPVYFLSTGLRTEWSLGGLSVLLVAALLLVASVSGKLLGVRIAGRLLGWPATETHVVGWLLQTKALIMIVFANVLLDKQVISSNTFTALLLMAVGSTMLTIPMVARHIRALGPISSTHSR